MDILLTVILPLSLAFIMFSLGLGLTPTDFTRVLKRPKAFMTGFMAQVILLPIIAFVLLKLFNLPGELAVGVMILALCPGGVTSNIMTRIAGGDLALSISLTAVFSLLAVFTVPFLVAFSADHFMGTNAPAINIASIAIAMFAITAVPVVLGVIFHQLLPGIVHRIEPWVIRIATLLFAIIVIGAVAANWSLFISNVITLGPLLIGLNILLIAIGFAIATFARLDVREKVAIAIETGVQNSTLGITVGSLIVEAANGLPAFSLPSGVYGITMYLVTIPFVVWMRGKTRMG